MKPSRSLRFQASTWLASIWRIAARAGSFLSESFAVCANAVEQVRVSRAIRAADLMAGDCISLPSGLQFLGNRGFDERDRRPVCRPRRIAGAVAIPAEPRGHQRGIILHAPQARAPAALSILVMIGCSPGGAPGPTNVDEVSV